jgi:soluble lytic murein transglycosylase-like protein
MDVDATIGMTWLHTGTIRRLFRGTSIIVAASLMVAMAPTTTKSDFGSRLHYSKQDVRRAVTIYAKRYRLDPALLHAVIKAESDFRQHVVSRKGAVGLMQLTPDTAVMLRVADIHDPIQNIRGGAKQLRYLLNLYDGNLPLALAAYNAGVHRVKKGKVPRIRETRAYVRKVLRYYHRFQSKPSTPRAIKPVAPPGRLGGSSSGRVK